MGMDMTQGMRVRQIKGANVGAEGTITHVVPSRFPDRFIPDGVVRVFFEGIQFPAVAYLDTEAHLSIEPAE
jgi:hypothetical protein